MKKSFLIIALCILASSVYAQYTFDMYGTTTSGGAQGIGSTYRIDYSGNHFVNSGSITAETPNGKNPYADMVSYNGKLYGIMREGGAGNYGSLFEWDPITNIYITKHIFDSITGANPESGMIVVNDKLYGTTTKGGVNNDGVLYVFDPAASMLAVKTSFANSVEGRGYRSKLCYVPALNKFYGTAFFGGAHNYGVLYEYNPGNNVITRLVDFQIGGISAALSAVRPCGGLTFYQGKLYGFTTAGGSIFNTNIGTNNGVIYTYDPFTTSNPYKELFVEFGLDSTGISPIGEPIIEGNKIYGITGSSILNIATPTASIFEFDTLSKTITKRYPLPAFNEVFSGNSPIKIGNKIYGILGRNNILFEYTTTSNQYRVLKNLDFFKDGFDSHGALSFFNNKLYGSTSLGASGGGGTIFEYDITGSGNYAVKKIAGLYLGNGLQSSLVKNDSGTYYTTTIKGGRNDNGCLLEYHPKTNSFTQKTSFEKLSSSSGFSGNPYGRLFKVNERYYGFAKAYNTGGTPQISNDGFLYSYNPTISVNASTNAITGRFGFDSAKGRNPVANLFVQNGFLEHKLYGVTRSGGANDKGVLYKLTMSQFNNIYDKLHEFAGADGANPSGIATSSENNDILFGTTENGGDNNAGTIFNYNLVSNSFTKVFNFTNSLGSKPQGGLIYSYVDNVYYGYTTKGGTYGNGVIYYWNNSDLIYLVMHHFTNEEGTPSGELIYNGNTNKLYGVTKNVGLNNKGIVFELDVSNAPSVFTKKADFMGNDGENPLEENGLLYLPADVAENTQNSCVNLTTQNITNFFGGNILLTDGMGNATAEILSPGTDLGDISTSYYTQNLPIRVLDGRKYLDRNITIKVANQPVNENVQVVLYISKKEYDKLKAADNNIVSPADIEVVKNSDDCSNTVTNGVTILPATYEWWGGVDSNLIYKVQVPSFSTFYFRSKFNVALPLQFLAFTATAHNSSNVLNWQTANAYDVKSFSVERSSEGLSFTSIGTIAANNGTTAISYNFDDMQPVNGKNYYRIKQIDVNGQFKYSPIAVVDRLKNSFTWTVYPNPVIDKLTIKSNGVFKNTLVSIINTEGKTLLTKNIPNYIISFNIDMQAMPSGLYYIKIEDKLHSDITKIIKY
jgi:uncharacterized repeat protein (TIGR03803 family)